MAAAVGDTLDHQRLLGEIFGIDVGAFPAQLSTINAVRHLSDESNYPRPSRYPLYDIPLTGRSVRSVALEERVIGNPPYIRRR